ncbi:MAG: aldo/keto reductase family protein [Candidatus Heimdallarchaeota archaeon]
MKYRQLGNTGTMISEISLGAWITYGGSVDKEGTEACLTEAVENGVNFIDIADVYSGGNAERVIGEILKEETFDRKKLVISSKVFFPMSDDPNDRGLGRKHILESVEGTLERLALDYIDIYFCHRYDYQTPLEETILAMTDLIKGGDVHYWGTSNWPATKLERAVGIARYLNAYSPKAEQPLYNMLHRYIEQDVMQTCAENGIGIVCWSPLAQGLLTGKYQTVGDYPADSRAATTQWMQRDITEENLAKVRKLEKVAQSLDTSVAQLSLAWILRRPEITCPITGATRPEHVIQNVQATEVTLEEATLEEIEKILDNKWEAHPAWRPFPLRTK